MLRDLKNFNMSEVEEKTLEFWKTSKIFQKSLKNRQGKKVFRFFEGPPTANGRPGIHHVLARSFKDFILRYKSMQGFYVPRKAGWDTHGLPVELGVEKKLGLKSKKEIEAFGVAKFNKECKSSVWEFKSDWEKLTERMGFWLDMDNPYVTYENNYIESIWNLLSEIDKKKYLYKGHKVLPWCSRCGTALSSHEIAQGYKEVEDESVFVKFKILKNQRTGTVSFADNAYIVSWTTTPWTLPGNVALAVGEKINYVGVKVGGEIFVLAEERVSSVLGENAQILFKLQGKDLIGLKYEPLFDIKSLKSAKSYQVYGASFVTTSDGSGVVHTAVMYGEDDYVLGEKLGLPRFHTVDDAGKFVSEVKDFAGEYVKSKATEAKIFEYLKSNNNLFKRELYKHEYPFCWRCSTPILYYARSSWFIKMSAVKNVLIKENKKINWIPEHVKNGRFGEWLKDLKDWAISRERYWGTPLPIWECSSCNTHQVVSSISDLEKYGENNSNNFFLVRHGEAEHNLKNILAMGDYEKKNPSHLTKKGIKQIESLAKKLKTKKIDLIFSSPYARTLETSEIISKTTGAKIHKDDRLKDIDTGVFNGQKIEEYIKFHGQGPEKFSIVPQGGESKIEVRRRIVEAFREINSKYKGKNIVIVSHGDPLWLLDAALNSRSEKETFEYKYIQPGELRNIKSSNLPFNGDGLLDVHKPFIDEVHLNCKKCHKKMTRVKEVLDVWFDSGAMPFASIHYPFENSNLITTKKSFPADYISEGMDQTRGWFYTLLAISCLLGKGAPYKNVISTGLLLDKNGQKMSKSKGNVVEPMETIKKFGVDVIRWFFFSASDPGEAKRYDEAEIMKVYRKLHMLVYNSFAYLKTYSHAFSNISKVNPDKSPNLLDKWILIRLNEAVEATTKSLDAYDALSATKAIEALVDDLSRWYIRRSRDRFASPSSESDLNFASATLNFALLNISKLIAPLSPFLADAVYKSLYAGNKLESVHLETWPKFKKLTPANKALIVNMEALRKICSDALSLRQEIGIKIRQPLAKLSVKSAEKNLSKNKDLIEIIKDEINVKEVVFGADQENELELDRNITPELFAEGRFREILRTCQKARQDAGLKVGEGIEISISASKENLNIINKFIDEFKSSLKAKRVALFEFSDNRKISHDFVSRGEIDSSPFEIFLKKI